MEKLPEIVLLTETMLNDMTNIQIQGYSFCGKGRIDKGCGGVGILVRNDLMNHVTPHESHRQLEIMWVSIRRQNQHPLFIGVYYGKQESVKKNEIEKEFEELTEEILELKRDGDILLCMDGNAKVGLLGEEISRNGKLLLKMADEVPLVLINSTEKCSGKVTRVNRKKTSEKSAIDFVLTCQETEDLIQAVDIDEEQHYTMKNEKAASDHNSILIRMKIHDIDHHSMEKKRAWRTNASEEQWDNLAAQLHLFEQESKDIMMDSERPIDERYNCWFNEIEKILNNTIGKKTIKVSKPEKFSHEVQSMRAEKRRLKKLISNESDKQKRQLLKDEYIEKQKQTRDQIQNEREERINDRFIKMIEDRSQTTFWNEIRNGNKKPPSSWIAIKDEEGKRILDPKKNKERAADYYQGLFTRPQTIFHPYHEEVTASIPIYESDFSHDHFEYNSCPTLAEIKQAISNKKNGKGTTDLPNEILKNGGEEMAKLIHHVVTAFWNGEEMISIWNEGLITSIWKGKGDKEKMDCHRGITVSSAISMIPEEIIHNRMRTIIDMTPAQGGGKKGTATRDHVFILRSAISAALHQKRQIFLTFYDVKKAYDHADPDHMLHVAWNSGLKGKLWRLTKLLNTNLTARVNTRYGKSRKILREIGGKQGGKIMTFLFAKLMDTLAEDIQRIPDLGISINDVDLGVLEWVDDVISFAENLAQQEKTLDFINDFAIKHKFKWGPDKCKVMQIGIKNDPEKKWSLGENTITSTNKYTYLGDIVTADGKNQENLDARMNRIQSTTRRVMANASIEVLKAVKTKSLLRLHESYSISSILINCETWVLTKTDKEKLDKMEIWAYKKILNLPITTPTAAIFFETRSLFTSIRVVKKQLKYLHVVLTRDDADSCKKTLYSSVENGYGWGKYIVNVLEECGLSLTLEDIKTKKKNEWKSIVEDAAWTLNRKRMLEFCMGKGKARTKTLQIAKKLEEEDYKHESAENNLFELPRHSVKMIIMARYGMLDCAANYRGKYGTNLCTQCKVIDDENHRINFCKRWQNINLYRTDYILNFDTIFSDNIEEIRQMSDCLESIWNLENGKNEMRS